MSESFVDLTYRGLAIGKRVRLAQVRPSSGYLELPAPMPVGTTVAISTDEGVSLEARVAGVHEQIGGADRVPGMFVRPVLTEDKASLWWQARVTLPDDPDVRTLPAADPERSRTVRPRSKTIPNPIPAPAEATASPPLVPAPPVLPAATPAPDRTSVMDPREAERLAQMPVEATTTTMVMNAADQERLAEMTRPSVPDLGNGIPLASEHPIVDDGQRTTVMDAVDVNALGLGIEVSASGSMTMVHDDDLPEDADASRDSGPIPTDDKSGGTPKKKRRKRR